MRAILPAFAAVLLIGCAHSGPRFERSASLERAAKDPWEANNRQMYRFNKSVDNVTLRPAANVYRGVVPRPIRSGVRNFFRTAGEPANALNALLQAKPKRALQTLDRMLTNIVFGLAVMDPATKRGLERKPNDFGQTLAVWGIHSGPFVMTPLLGPSTPRDTLGFIVDFLIDPVNFFDSEVLTSTQRNVKLGFRVIDFRSNLMDQGEQMLKGAADEYATVRAAWLQMRRYDLHDGNPPPLPGEDEDVAPYPDDLPPPAVPAGNAPPAPPMTADGAPAMTAEPPAASPSAPPPAAPPGPPPPGGAAPPAEPGPAPAPAPASAPASATPQ